MSAEQPPSFENPEPTPEPSPELEQFFYERPEVNAESMLILADVPRMIGGPRSKKFLVRDPGSTPDSAPDCGACIDLNKAQMPADSATMDAFDDYCHEAEAQAERQYDATLLDVQDRIGAARETGIPITTLFIPDNTDGSAAQYDRRLQRLAQDTGMQVVVGKKTEPRGSLPTYFLTLEPPRADSVRQYWRRRAQEYKSKGATPDPVRPSRTDTVNALMSLTAEAKGREAQRQLAHNLQTISASDPQPLRDLLLEETAATSRILPAIQHLASEEGAATAASQGWARIIAAKIDDLDCLSVIMNELRERDGGFGSGRRMTIPLSIYMQNDPEFAATTIQRVRQMIGKDQCESHELATLMGALQLSGDLRVGTFVSNCLDPPAEAGIEYARKVLAPIARHLPEYIKAVRAAPDSDQKRTVISGIEGAVAQFTGRLSNGSLNHVADSSYDPIRFGDMLLTFRNPKHRDVLRRYMLDLFRDSGSIITSERFERRYLQYRVVYGDIPDIQPDSIRSSSSSSAPQPISSPNNIGEVIEVILETIATMNESQLAANGAREAVLQARQRLEGLLIPGSHSAQAILGLLEQAADNLNKAQEASGGAANGLGGYGGL